jgi:hypothetical protein
MPTRHFSVLEDHIYPTDFFPFATTTSRDPVTGAEGSVLDRARALGAVPKLFYVNNSSEYWNRAASLIATDPAGARDLEITLGFFARALAHSCSIISNFSVSVSIRCMNNSWFPLLATGSATESCFAIATPASMRA